jgi:gas vesicle protein GvpL/GvpF/DnaJ-like protein
VSRTRLPDHRQMARPEALRRLVAHQKVLEAIMTYRTVLPVRFGTVLPSDAAVRRFQEQAAPALTLTLAEFSGRLQMEVVVTWRLEDVFREIAAEAEIAHAAADAARDPSGQPDAARVSVGRMVKAALDRRRVELQRSIVPALRTVSVRLTMNSVLDDEMVLNVALLLRSSQREELDRVLAELDRRSGGRLRFRCIGPLPPYSFATVAVEIMEFRRVDEARRLLGLGPRASSREIRQAYRRLAARRHPDVGDEGAAMTALNDAYARLMAYGGTPSRDDGERVNDRLLAFDRRSVASRLLVSVEGREVA